MTVKRRERDEDDGNGRPIRFRPRIILNHFLLLFICFRSDSALYNYQVAGFTVAPIPDTLTCGRSRRKIVEADSHLVALIKRRQEDRPSIAPSSSSVALFAHHESKFRYSTTFNATNFPWPRLLELFSIVSTQLIGPVLLKINQEAIFASALTQTLASLGPTYIKFGQALSARSDLLPEAVCSALAQLQSDITDDGKDFMGVATAQQILQEEWSDTIFEEGPTASGRHSSHVAVSPLPVDLDSLTCVATASIGQVFRAHSSTAGEGDWAIKIQRPQAAATVAQDTALLIQLARLATQFVPTDLVAAVNEFLERLWEELDYQREVSNLQAFAAMYGPGGTDPIPGVVVPHVYTKYCTDRVIAMEWLEGSKLVRMGVESNKNSNADPAVRQENLEILAVARRATLTQLFATGLMHADPHGGNLIKVQGPHHAQLGYLDFGMVSTIDATVRDALMCSIVEMVVCRDVEAVVDLFAELQIVREDVLLEKRAELVESMTRVLEQVFEYPDEDATDDEESTTSIPQLRFDTLLGELVLLIARFEFELPPYFINNARALATLEGLTRQLDQSHNTMEAIYPFCLRRLFRNPTQSPIVERTLQKVLRDPETGRLSWRRQQRFLRDIKALTGKSRKRVILDILGTKGGRRLSRQVLLEQASWRRKQHT